MNVLFSDEFAEDFADLGNLASRLLLDSGLAGNERHFWERVASAFSEDDEGYGVMRFTDDEIINDSAHINPAKIVLHDWRKLRKIWKGVNADYKTALNKFQQSGTHDTNFFAFCGNKVEVYYLRKYLDLRPNITATVEADLPDECALSTEGENSGRRSVTSSASKKRKNDIADALSDYQTEYMNSELMQKRIHILEEDHQEQKERNKMKDWAELNSLIRGHYLDLENAAFSADYKNRIKKEIEALEKRMNTISAQLGLL